MVARLVILLLFVGYIHTSQGRKCWHCENARSDYECRLIGHLQPCLTNQEYCQNEIRAIAGGMFTQVTKRCKQDNSCDNNKMQNYTGSTPFQCATEEPHSVCRCCCGFDNCNGPDIVCVHTPPECDPPEAPTNGYVLCPANRPVGTECKYRCRYGHVMEGADKTKCELLVTSELIWTNGPPICIVKPCEPLPDPEVGGSMTCTDEWNIGSMCTFSCPPDKVLIGSEKSTCSIFSTWTDEVPECRDVTCFPPRPLDPNFLPPKGGDCTDSYNYLSECTFACHPDYDMVGEEEIVCGDPIKVNKKASWNRKPPKCRIKTCQPKYCPNNQVGGKCTRSCGRCQELDGASEVECTRDGWVPPTLGECRDIFCEISPPEPVNGGVTCSSIANKCGESCEYFCDDGYQLVGTGRTTCGEDGQWSLVEPPKCEIVDCDPIIIPGITATCTNGLAVGSDCVLACDDEEKELVGPPDVTCKKDATDPRPVWDPTLNQYCRFILCPNYPSPGQSPRPDAGQITCGPNNLRVNSNEDRDRRSGWRQASTCNIVCNEGFKVQAAPQTECTARGQWTQQTICCVECLSNVRMDVVMLLDKTDTAYWETWLTFLPQWLDYEARQHTINFNITFIPFGSEIDTENAVDFMSVDDDRRMITDDDFLRKTSLANVELNADEDSNIGLALQEAAKLFGYHNNRAPVILVLTTKAPNDLNLAKAEAEKIDERKIHLRFIPITAPQVTDAGASRVILNELQGAKVTPDSTGRSEVDFNSLVGENLVRDTARHCQERSQSGARCVYDSR